MRKTDISNYNDTAGKSSVSVGAVFKETFALIAKLLVTAFLVMIITGVVVGVSVMFYVIDIANEPNTINLEEISFVETSHVYIKDDNGNFPSKPDKSLYSTENRVWVKFKDIPQNMVNAQIAIEDKRFYEHEGVDWYRTGGAVYSLATGQDDFGGSTITQQLIKNITNDNEVSITRKLREIFRAIQLEKEYTKDDILEAYLNIVNYGSGCRGVQSAARLYFNKDIKDCTVCECAAIAGITQNPYAFDPLIFPENNQKRREIVLGEMFNQEMITQEEYDKAMKESENLRFFGYIIEEEEDWSWYDDRLFRDVSRDLAKAKRISVAEAEEIIYTKGLKIYSAMDKKAQEAAEKKIREWSTPDDKKLDVGFMMMDFEGRVLATVGGRQERDGRLLWDNASQARLQPGSTIKPLTSFTPAIESKKIHYSSLILDEPSSNWSYLPDGSSVMGPKNWYDSYYGLITATRALSISSNAATVSVLRMVGMDQAYSFLTDKLNFTHLDEDDKSNLAGLSIGGFKGGVTVEEMTASYAIFCNEGYYYEPYTYYWVEDSDGNILLDNRDRGQPDRTISAETATIMNRMLHDVCNSGEEGMGYRTAIDGWDIIGKTGTTDSSFDNWFVGASPYAVAGIWTGHSNPGKIAESEQSKVHVLWHDIMEEYLQGKEKKIFSLSQNVEQHNFSKTTGNLLSYMTDDMAVGYYTFDNMPGYEKIPTKPEEPEISEDENSEDEDSEDEDSEDEDSEDEPEESSEEEWSEDEPEESSEEELSEDEPVEYSEEEPVTDYSEEEPDDETGE